MKQFLLLTLLLFATFLNAQKIITEQRSEEFSESLNFKNVFEESNYTQVSNESGKKVFIENQEIQPSEQGVNAELQINVNFDSNLYELPLFVVVYDESGYTNYGFLFGATTTSVTVPDGVYDIYAGFTELSSGNDVVVIKELINTAEISSVTIDVTEAENYISINGYDENGDLLEPGIPNPDLNSNSGALFRRTFFFNPSQKGFANQTFIWGNEFADVPVWNFYINDVSDRYSIINSLIAIGYVGDDHYFTKFETLEGVTASVALANDPQDWTLHHEKIQPSPHGLTLENNLTAFTTSHIYKEKYSIGEWIGIAHGPIYNPDQGFKAYLNSLPEDDQAEILVYPAIIDHRGTVDSEEGTESFFILGNSITKKGNEIVYGSSGAASYDKGYFLGNKYFQTEIGLEALPVHPRFSFLQSENESFTYGNNSPTTSVGFMDNAIKSNFIGRYGEKREGDLFLSTVEVKHNSQTAFSGNYIEFLSFPNPTSGEMEVTITNENILVDEFEGKNITKLFYNNSNSDKASPTLQHLQFRNSEEIVTDRFASAEDGFVRIAAGDFIYEPREGWNSYFNYQEGVDVEFLYSIYDQNDWNEIEITEYPEYFQTPGFGNYYEASLENVIVPQQNTWFDVKIICTDAAGNRQEQIVSPAFKIEQATMGIDEMNNTNFSVYPNPFSNEINIQLPENLKESYIFRISDLTGKTIYSQKQTDKSFAWNGSSLLKGIYILSIENNGITIAKKIIKK